MALQLLLFLVVLFGKGWRSEQGAQRNGEEAQWRGRCQWDFHLWLCSEGSCSVNKQRRWMRERKKKSACSEWLPFGRTKEITASVMVGTSFCQASWVPSLPGSLGWPPAFLLASCLARNGRGSQRRERGRGTQESILSWPLCERVSHPSVSSTHLYLPIFLPFLSWKSKHMLRCLIHNEWYGTNGSFHVTEGKTFKNER